MEINLSTESVEVIVNSLRSSRNSLKEQIRKNERINEPSRLAICKSQLEDVEYTLSIFTGAMEVEKLPDDLFAETDEPEVEVKGPKM